MGWDHGADDTFPDTATKKEEKMLGSRAYFCLCFFFQWNFAMFSRGASSAYPASIFSACLI